MSRLIIKADKDENIYLLWSYETDSPEFIGSASELTEYIIDEARTKAQEQAQKAIKRAQETGSSSKIFGIGNWNDKHIRVVEGSPPSSKYTEYYIERSRLLEYASLLMKGDEKSAQSILVIGKSR